MSNVFRAGQPPLDPTLEKLLGTGADSMQDVEARAQELFPHDPPIVWECDAVSFKFSYVSARAEDLLGYDRSLWLEPMFWAEKVVHGDDRDDAVSYCSLATKKMRDHMFEYRGVSASGKVVWLSDYVKVVKGGDGKPERLRGAMFDITSEKTSGDAAGLRQAPSLEELTRA